MGKREDALLLLRTGYSPKEIAKKQGVSLKTIVTYLNELVGRGILRRSDILFSIPKEIRATILLRRIIKEALQLESIDHFEKIREIIQQASELESTSYLKKAIGDPSRRLEEIAKSLEGSLDKEDIEVEEIYGDSDFALGDMYDDIRNIEIYLHDNIRNALVREYGEVDSNWWVQGVEEGVKEGCEGRQRDDRVYDLEDPYCYTNLIDLWKIMEDKWDIFRNLLPDTLTANKKRLKRDFYRLNSIRKNIMHPVRSVKPSEDDFKFIKDFSDKINFNYQDDESDMDRVLEIFEIADPEIYEIEEDPGKQE